jgi:hypothetical protein
MRASFPSKNAATFFRQPGFRTDEHPSRPLALRPGLSTGLPLSRMNGPGRPFAPTIVDQSDVKGAHARRRFTTARRPCSPRVITATARGSLQTYVDRAACQIGNFSLFAEASQKGLDRRRRANAQPRRRLGTR